MVCHRPFIVYMLLMNAVRGKPVVLIKHHFSLILMTISPRFLSWKTFTELHSFVHMKSDRNGFCKFTSCLFSCLRTAGRSQREVGVNVELLVLESDRNCWTEKLSIRRCKAVWRRSCGTVWKLLKRKINVLQTKEATTPPKKFNWWL